MAIPHIDITPLGHDTISVEVPVVVDPRRAPQLDTIKGRSRNGCACASSRAEGSMVLSDGGGGGGGHADEPCPTPQEASLLADSASDDDGISFVDGEEGVEGQDSQVVTGDLGPYTIRAIHEALAKHTPRLCLCALFRSSSDDAKAYLFRSLSASGVLPAESLMAEASSDVYTPRSAIAASIRSSDSAWNIPRGNRSLDLADVGGQFESFLLPRSASSFSNFTLAGPLWLAHERAYAFNMEIGGGAAAAFGLVCTPELSEGESRSVEFSECDI